jgi:hypothetical protein
VSAAAGEAAGAWGLGPTFLPVLVHLQRQGVATPARSAPLLRLLLGHPGMAPLPSPRRSGLNPDGVPLQLCVSARPGRSAHVLIGDPAAHLDDPVRRQQAAVACARALVRRCGAGPLAPAVEATLLHMLPDDAAGLAACRMGPLWLAAGVEQPSVALYAGASWPGASGAGWKGVSRWLAAVLDEPAQALAALMRLLEFARPESACVEGLGLAQARAKIYFRLVRADAVGALGLLAMDDERVHAFVAEVVGARELPLSALVFSLSFDLDGGAWRDAKLDICGHCVRRSAAEWQLLLRRAQRVLDLDTGAARALLAAPGLELACIGIGLDRQRTLRLNTYAKPLRPACA